jgi:hypothetical protein
MKKGNCFVFIIGLSLVLLVLFAGVRHGDLVVKSWRYDSHNNLYVTFYDVPGEHLANACAEDMMDMLEAPGVDPGIEYWELFRIIFNCKVYIWGIADPF